MPLPHFSEGGGGKDMFVPPPHFQTQNLGLGIEPTDICDVTLARFASRCWARQMCPPRGGSRNSLRGGSGPEFFEGGGGVRVQVRGNFHILTSKKKQKQPLKGGLNPLTPPPSGSATAPPHILSRSYAVL